MTDEQKTQSGEAVPEETAAEAPTQKRDPVGLITLIVLVVCLVAFWYYVRADRLTPYTSQARIHALIVPVAPRVSGHVVDVGIQLHSRVERDQVLFEIDTFILRFAHQHRRIDISGTNGVDSQSVAGMINRHGLR